MSENQFPVLGIVLAVASFFVELLRRKGIKNERVSAANANLVRILVRRIVLEGYVPNETELSRLIEGKTRDHHVRTTEVFSTAQLLNTVYTRIMESDLIHADQREAILGRITPVLVQFEAEPVREEDLVELDSSGLHRKSTRLRLTILATLVSAFAGLITVIPDIPTIDSSANLLDLFPMIVTTAAVSFALIGILYGVLQLRASQEEPRSKADEVTKYVSFEHQVRKALVDLGCVRGPTKKSDAFDFLLERRSRKFVIEVRAWATPIPVRIVSLVATRLRDAARTDG